VRSSLRKEEGLPEYPVLLSKVTMRSHALFRAVSRRLVLLEKLANHIRPFRRRHRLFPGKFLSAVAFSGCAPKFGEIGADM